VLVEIDVGAARCGVQPGPEAVALAERIAESRHLRFGGIQAYQGSAQHIREPERRAAAIHVAVDAARRTVEQLRQRGLDCPVVGGGGTGSFAHEAASGVYTEIQAGSYAFMDADYARNEGAPPFRQSLFVLATVMSASSPRIAVLDAGHKAVPTDSGPPLVWRRPGVTYAGASDEHGKLTVEDPSLRPALGEKLRLVPAIATRRWTATTGMWAYGAAGWNASGRWPPAAPWLECHHERWLTGRGAAHPLPLRRRSGPAVVLLHGSGLDARISACAHPGGAGARLPRLRADLPGFGGSDPLPAHWGLPEFSAFLGPLLDAMELERASLLGFSLGGGLALLFALEAPERVERLVLVSAALLDDRFPGGILGAALSDLLAFGPLITGVMRQPWLAPRLMRGAFPRRPDAAEPWLVEAIMGLARNKAALDATRQLQRREIGWRRLRTNAVPRLRELRPPTLILHGTRDMLIPFAAASAPRG
jgi:pimeloyl-ACP methyl ester carboxylesterase